MGCGGDRGAASGQGSDAMKLTSSAFGHNQPIPRQYSEEGASSSPPLQWSGLPDAVRQLALICDDPDAPQEEPWVHWVLYGLSPSVTSLPQALPRVARLTEPAGALQGQNSWPSDNIGYRGPYPPRGHGTHHYHFKLYALDKELELQAGADKAALLAAMKGHILAEAELIGTYER
ncbi:MAG: YbhB/YbcL family Raf kinase inhibitor-like protein [Anaerolineales bacterium]|nr:YbhB/YbcL family Raf kinase inhibitor-like protein [Anaerolineales bacterium]